LTSTTTLRGSRAILIALLLVAAATLGLAWRAASAQAFSDLNDIQCDGHISAGQPEVGVTDQQVGYTFGCSAPITGYQIQAQIPITGFDVSTTTVGGDGQPVSADSFNCEGDFPGIAFDCVGTYSAVLLNNTFEKVNGEFSIGTKLCAEPRVDPLLTVVTATATSAGVVTQAMSGPFDLGRPYGCPKDADSGDARIGPDGTPVDKAADAAAKKAAAAAKAKKQAALQARLKAKALAKRKHKKTAKK
jgi:hypothetical protein